MVSNRSLNIISKILYIIKELKIKENKGDKGLNLNLYNIYIDKKKTLI